MYWRRLSFATLSLIFSMGASLPVTGQVIGRSGVSGFDLEEIWLSAQSVEEAGFVFEALVDVNDVLRAGRTETAHLSGVLHAGGAKELSLALFNRVGGVLAGYDAESPDVDSLLSGSSLISAHNVGLLQRLLDILCEYAKRVGGLVWVPKSLMSDLDLAPSQPETDMQVVLLPGYGLWKAPGYSAARLEGRSGPLLLFRYNIRADGPTQFFEVGPAPIVSDAAYVAFVRREEALEWKIEPCRIVAQFQSGEPTRLQSLNRSQAGSFAPAEVYAFSKGAVYPVLHVATDNAAVLVRCILVKDESLLLRFPDMPFISICAGSVP